MIKILKIEFNNFRQYRQIAIDFSKECENNLHILKAKNGTGKTTFLNAVLWCLYAEEKYLNDTSRALPIINESLVQQSNPGTKLEANVRITICDGISNIVFSRTMGFTVTEDPMRNIKNVSSGSSKFTVSITNLNDPNKNTVVYDDEAYTSGIVKQYFDGEIFDYYFFDGENLENYFSTDSNKTGKIKNSIYNIAQVTMLETASKHVMGMASERFGRANKEFSGDTSLYDDLQTLQDDIQRLELDNKKYEEENKIFEARVDEINKILEDVKPVKLKQQERTRLETRLDQLKIDRKSFIIERNNFITKYTILLNYYPLMKSTLDMIIEKEKSGSLPPDIDKKLLKKILTEHITTCPVCKQTIGQHSVIEIQKLIETLDVDSGTSNKLMEIKAPLEEYISQAKNFEREKNRLLARGKTIEDAMNEIYEQLDEISSFLSKIGVAEEINITALESERKYKNETIKSNIRSISSNETQIKNKQERIKILEKQIADLEQRTKTKNMLMDQVRVLRKLSSAFEEVKNSISNEIRLEIEDITWKFFDAMIWKTNTFAYLKISNDYVISVFNKNGKEITGSMSATELMALAYSFTFAIHEASGKNCPLIVDSPLGRVSDDNRVNMAKELLKVSKEKQIIMLFTPDEYSEEVRNIYDVEAGSVRDIKLSEDENEILKVGA